MLVGRGIRSGRFRRVNPEEAGAVILALIDGVALQRTFDAKAFTHDRAVRFCEEAILRYLASTTPSRARLASRVP